jgi:hypothetical protein
MQWAQLVLDYLKVLAWPILVVFILVRFREPIHDLLGRLRKADALGASLDFEGGVARAASVLTLADSETSASTSGAKVAAPSLPQLSDISELSGNHPFGHEELDRLLRLAAKDSPKAIQEGWKAVEATAQWCAARLGLVRPNAIGVVERPTSHAVFQHLKKAGRIDEDMITTADELDRLRYSLVRSHIHEWETNVTVLAATTFVTTAFRLAAAIAEATTKEPPASKEWSNGSGGSAESMESAEGGRRPPAGRP